MRIEDPLITTSPIFSLPWEGISHLHSEQEVRDTLDSAGSSVCCSGFVQNLFNFVGTYLTTFKDWIVSFFVQQAPSIPAVPPEEEWVFHPPLEDRQILKNFRSSFTSDDVASHYQCLSTFECFLAELDEVHPPKHLTFKNGFTIQALKDEGYFIYQGLPEKIQRLLEEEFRETPSPSKTQAGFPRVGQNFVECMMRDPIKARAIALDLLRCQDRYYFGKHCEILSLRGFIDRPSYLSKQMELFKEYLENRPINSSKFFGCPSLFDRACETGSRHDYLEQELKNKIDEKLGYTFKDLCITNSSEEQLVDLFAKLLKAANDILAEYQQLGVHAD